MKRLAHTCLASLEDYWRGKITLARLVEICDEQDRRLERCRQADLFGETEPLACPRCERPLHYTARGWACPRCRSRGPRRAPLSRGSDIANKRHRTAA